MQRIALRAVVTLLVPKPEALVSCCLTTALIQIPQREDTDLKSKENYLQPSSSSSFFNIAVIF